MADLARCRPTSGADRSALPSATSGLQVATAAALFLFFWREWVRIIDPLPLAHDARRTPGLAHHHRDHSSRSAVARSSGPAGIEADQQLKHCVERLAGYTQRVFAALYQM
jgi:hypothetical protein